MSKPTAILSVALLAPVLLAGCQLHRPVDPPPAMTAVGIVLHAPRPGLYTAGQPASSDWAMIAGRGVTTVINLRTPAELAGRDEAAEVGAAGMRYAEIPVDGAAGIGMEKARALRSLLDRADGPVLVHCASGNRVGALIALGAADAGASTEDAIAQGRAAGMTGAETRVRELLSQD